MKLILKKLKNFFKKNKGKKIKSFCKKRKIIISAGLAWGLMFGSLRFFYSRLSSLNYDNQVVHERVLSNEIFNLLDEDDRQGILVKNYVSGTPLNTPSNIWRQGQGPSNFPVSLRFVVMDLAAFLQKLIHSLHCLY